MGGSRAWRTRAVFGALVVMLALSDLAPAFASDPSADTGDTSSEIPATGLSADLVTLTSEKLDISRDPGPSMALWTWSKGRRAYTISRFVTTDPLLLNPQSFNQSTVVAYDLDTQREVNRTTLPHLYASLAGDSATATERASRLETAAVDEERGLLYMAHTTRFNGPVGSATSWGHSSVEAAKDGKVCAPSGRIAAPCLSGVYVLDGETLDVVRRFPVDKLTVDGSPIVSPHLVAMDYSPPRFEGDSGKLHLLVAERVLADGALDHSVIVDSPGDHGFGAIYAVQVDPDQGTVDWVTRIDGCRGRQRRRVNTGGSDRGPDTHRSARSAIFRNLSTTQPAVWVGCHNTGQTAALVRVPLDERGFPATLPVQPGNPGDVVAKASDPGGERVGQQDLVSQRPGAQLVFPGPRYTVEMLPDPGSERILLRVVDGNPVAEVWWVFDGAKGVFVGTVGIGRYDRAATAWGFDRTIGRLYVLAPPQRQLNSSGGLYVADIRRTPLPQALTFPEFGGIALAVNGTPIAVDTGLVEDGGPRRLYLRPGEVYRETAGSTTPAAPSFYIGEDRLPLSVDPEVDISAHRTVDLDEVAGVTKAQFDGAARGYAFRTLVVGGLESVGRLGPIDTSYSEQNTVAGSSLINTAPYSECARTNRQVVVGFVGPRDAAVVDGNGSRGGAEPLVVDSATRSDSEAPMSRCSMRGTVGAGQVVPTTIRALDNLDWERVWSTGLFSRPPVGEPTLPWQFGDGDTSCVSSDEEPSASFGDPVTGMFASHVECEAESASGYGYARGVGVDGLNVSEAVSKFRIYRDPGRGIVSRVESIARGIDIGGVVKIDSVRGVAESWANGRMQPVPAEDQDADYDPNCDFERTAGTCFSRHIFGVKSPVYSCGPCGDEQALVDGLSRAMGANGKVRLRNPDETLRDGSPNGYIAAIQKPAHERFGDVVLNDDLLQTVVPVLEITKYTTPGVNTSNRRALQVYQFAGVEVSSSYGIQCLLVYDEASNTCAAEKLVPGSLTVSLADGDGVALAGGGFEVRADVDGDGVVGLVDTLLPDGACVTAEDGIGTCQFEGLQPGSYLVTQTVAPSGFAMVDDTWVSEVASGEARTVAFTNSANVSTIDVSAVDEDGKPVSGAVFAVFADADADGKIASDVQPVATCTTGGDGKCSMSVPVGSYVLVQTSAPAGLEGIEPVAFAFASGGQTAAVGVTNYGAGIPDTPPAAGPVYTEPVAYSPPVETVVDYTPRDTVEEPRISVPERVGGTVIKVIQAPGDVLRMLSRDPMAAAAWIATLILFLLAAAVIRRRHSLHLMQ